MKKIPVKQIPSAHVVKVRNDESFTVSRVIEFVAFNFVGMLASFSLGVFGLICWILLIIGLYWSWNQ